MLEQIAEELWTYEQSVRMPGGIIYPARTSIVRASDGTLVLYAPLAIDDALAAALADIGRVGHIVASNVFHHLYFAEAAARYPSAATYGARGLTKRRRDLSFGVTLDGDTSDEHFGADVQTRFVPGTAVNETVLIHRPSRSLIVTDLVMNIGETDNWTSKFVFNLLGVRGKVHQSPLWRLGTRQKSRATAFCESLLDADWDRLVMAHGQIVESDAREQLRNGLSWMLSG